MIKLTTLTIAATLLTTAIGAGQSSAKPTQKPLGTKPVETKPVVRQEPSTQRLGVKKGKPVAIKQDSRQAPILSNCPACGMG